MVETIEWTDAGVVMIDQRRLPAAVEYVTCRNYEEVAEALGISIGTVMSRLYYARQKLRAMLAPLVRS